MSAGSVIRAAPAIACRPIARHVLDWASWSAMAAPRPGQASLELLALWADTVQVHAVFHDRAAPELLLASVTVADLAYPALSRAWPAAAWFERMILDLWGHEARGGLDLRPWLDHGRWDMRAPLGARPSPRATQDPAPEFELHGGEAGGAHHVALGPVHGGIAEPGHFRFSAVGEEVTRLEVRLGYAHKGSLHLMRGKTPRAAARFAARLSGDSTVAHAVAFARAAEAASGTDAPPRAHALRGVMAELERVANHLGDLGAIAGDAGMAILPARLGFLREWVLRACDTGFGHRLMMDAVTPGGVAADIEPAGPAAIAEALSAIEAELPGLVGLLDTSRGLADRVAGVGTVAPALAHAFAAGGFVGRASGRVFDVRAWPGYPPYDAYAPQPALLAAGDVEARMRVRGAELVDSARLLRALLAALPDGPTTVPLPMTAGEGLGWAEGFRGDIWHWVRLEGGLIGAAFARDPSWLHWPLLEQAMGGDTGLADFPLVNRSINASYSGVDL